MAITDLALKYGLEDNQKIEKLSYLTLPNNLGQYRDGVDQLQSVNKKDRIKEYHEKTRIERKLIGEKAAAKRKLREEVEAK